MKKERNIEWENYRHPEFLQSLCISVKELKYLQLFLKRGAVGIINEMLRARKTKPNNFHRDVFATPLHNREKITYP